MSRSPPVVPPASTVGHETEVARFTAARRSDIAIAVKNSILLYALSALLMAPACDNDKKDDKASSDKAAGDKPSLMLANDTPACKAALKCCEAMVAADKGGEAKPEDINLSCSGVGMADSDDNCEQFKQGYAAALEAKGADVPADCK